MTKRKSRYKRRPRDMAFMGWVKQQRCLLMGVLGAGTCDGAVEADHAGQRSFGRKADDMTCISLCRYHHRCRTDYSHYFKGWDGARMREWCNQMIDVTQTHWRLWDGNDASIPF